MSTGSGQGLAAGPSTISGTYGALSATLSLTVIDGTAISASPNTLTLTAGGTATPFTVTCKKPDNSTDASPTYTATSSNTAVATVTQSGTTVTVTPVAGGSCTINLSYTSATSTATGSVPITVTAASGSVTSVTPIFNGSDVTQGAVLKTGTAYTFTAKDQSGNALDGTVGSWSSSDATNAPINATTGVCTPVAGITGATLTYTHTASGHTASVPVTVLKTPGTVFGSDSAENYASDAALYANIWNDVGNVPGATGGSGVKYNTGSDTSVTAITVSDASPLRKFMGKRTFLQTLPASSASAAGGLMLPYRQSKRVWILRIERIAPPGEVGPAGTAGQFAMFSNSGSPAFAEKAGPGVNFGGGVNGRAEMGYTGGNSKAGDCLYDWFPVDNGGSAAGTAVYAEPTVGNGKADFTLGGLWNVKVYLCEERTHGLISERQFQGPVGTLPALLQNVQAEFATKNADILTFDNANAFSWNWNTLRDADQLFYRNIADYEVVDGAVAGNGDPYGVLGTQPTPTLTSISVSSIAHGASGVVVTLTGTGFNDNTYPVFSNAGIRVTPASAAAATRNGANLVLTGSTQFQVTLDCLSSATLGAGTVKIYNAASQVSSATQPFTVT